MAASIGAERWARAEKLAQDIIQKVQPTTESEERRKALINYVQRLIRDSLHCEVFTYGSVPLKTFLPDGDIDLTAFGVPMLEGSLANGIVFILEREHRNKAAEFTVEAVQLISAEVKLVKCIVEDIVVDISFNQIGGLSSLCFLEKVDHLIGKDNLFKRSIILIKAWCYYESRILGAHCGLISTYALETLVLYIFHLFHSALDGPLAVLYKFLDYFSKFDWVNYCISLTGPVRLSSLPNIVAEAPESDIGDFLLSNEFIRYCVSNFSAPSRGFETNFRTFQKKHLNIVDPLKENNNLGRSVSKGNFYRIQSAFTYGARKLERILLESNENIADELNNFFPNTLGLHGSALWLDVEYLSREMGRNSFFPTHPVSESDSSKMVDVNCRMKSSCLADSPRDFKVVPYGISNKKDRYQEDRSKICQSVFPSKTVEPIPSKPFFAPHLYFTNSARNEETKKENSETKPLTNQNLDHDGPLATGGGSPKPLNGFSDLSGDYDYYFRCLQYGRRFYEHLSALPIPPLPPFPINNLLGPVWQPLTNGYSHGNPNGFIPSQVFYTTNPRLVHSAAFGFKEMPKPRGTGTYFPNMNQPPHGYRHPKGRNNKPSLNSPRTSDRRTTFTYMHGLESSSYHSRPPVGQSEDPSAVDQGKVNQSSSP